jgi:hypothetical protein
MSLCKKLVIGGLLASTLGLPSAAVFAGKANAERQTTRIVFKDGSASIGPSRENEYYRYTICALSVAALGLVSFAVGSIKMPYAQRLEMGLEPASSYNSH